MLTPEDVVGLKFGRAKDMAAEISPKLSGSEGSLDIVVDDLLDSVFCSIEPQLRDNKLDRLADIANHRDPKYRPRSVVLEETHTEIPLVRSPKSVQDKHQRRPLGDTRIEEVDSDQERDDFGKSRTSDLSRTDSLQTQDDCPLQFHNQFSEPTSEESVTNITGRQVPYVDEYDMNDTLLKLKHDFLIADSDEELEDTDDPVVDLDRHVLSSQVLDELPSSVKITDQERQNILAALVRTVERKAARRNKAATNQTEESPRSRRQSEAARMQHQRAESPRHGSEQNPEHDQKETGGISEETGDFLAEGNAHLRESLINVLDALRYVFQLTDNGAESESRAEAASEQSAADGMGSRAVKDDGSCHQCTQTGFQLGPVDDEQVEAEHLISGLEDEFQRWLWMHDKMIEDAHEHGFNEGLRNVLFLQDLVENGVQMIWSTRTERKQMEKYLKEKEREWTVMKNRYNSEIVDLRRENYHLLTSVTTADKEGSKGGRRVRTPHLKSLLKSKYDLEKAFSLNLEKQDKINELKLLVIQQQQCIRQLQEQMMDDQLKVQASLAQNPRAEDGACSGKSTIPSDDRQYKRENDNMSNVPPSTVRAADIGEHSAKEMIETDDFHIKNSDPLLNCDTEDNVHCASADMDLDGARTSRDISSESLYHDELKAGDIAKLQDVLYCDHAPYTPAQSTSPDIATLQVYNIGGQDLDDVSRTPDHGLQVLDIKYVQDGLRSAPPEDGSNVTDVTKSDSSKATSTEVSTSGSNKLASGDACL